MKFTHQLIYHVKTSDGYEDQLQFAGKLNNQGQLLALNGGKWYRPINSLCPDIVINLETGKYLSPLECFDIGCYIEKSTKATIKERTL